MNKYTNPRMSYKKNFRNLESERKQNQRLIYFNFVSLIMLFILKSHSGERGGGERRGEERREKKTRNVACFAHKQTYNL